MKKKMIMLYCDCPSRFDFFCRIYDAIQKHSDWLPRIIATDLSTITRCLLRGINSHLIYANSNTGELDEKFISYNSSLEKLKHLLNDEELKINYWSSRLFLRSFSEKNKKFLLYLCVWNGSQVVSMALADEIKALGGRCLFLELGNLPGLMQVDPVGVNAFSSIYYEPWRLSNFNIDPASFNNWVDSFISHKSKTAVPPQVTQKKPSLFWYALDYLSRLLPIIIARHRVSPWRMVFGTKTRKKTYIGDEKRTLKKASYCFFPMQVPDDTQLLVHSDIGNKEAIFQSLIEARLIGLPLVVKKHPADNSIESDYLLNEISSIPDVTISTLNTYDLIVGAEKVFTINSSVGIEAYIFEKKVKFWGRCVYEKIINRQMLANYVMGYLIPLEPFSNSEVSKYAVHQFLSRYELD